MSETIVAEYLGMTLQVDNLDHSNLAFFKHCAEHDFHLQKLQLVHLSRVLFVTEHKHLFFRH